MHKAKISFFTYGSTHKSCSTTFMLIYMLYTCVDLNDRAKISGPRPGKFV